MKKRRRIFIVFLAAVMCCGQVQIPVQASEDTGMTRQAEALDRGIMAIKTNEGVYLSWRYLGTDTEDTAFDIYRDGKKITEIPVTTSTNYIDSEGTLESIYEIRTLEKNIETEICKAKAGLEKDYFDISLDVPDPGVTPNGDEYTYTPGDASCADLDGDGEYEIILKWDPSNAGDNMPDGYRGNVYIDAYKLDGTKLWRVDMGRNIRSGPHYTQFMVYDFDSDGYGEMVCKTADGTRDGAGNYIGDKDADWRSESGVILEGPEYLTLFDGRTGEALDTVPYETARQDVNSWGDGYGNRSERYLGAVAYLNGVTPSVVMCRGYYARTTLTAYDVKDKKLVKRWNFDSNTPGNEAFAGQGNHNLAVADVDEDGFDEIVYGSCTIDHDGTGLYSNGFGHGDALHVGDFDPDSPGLEIYGVLEHGEGGSYLKKAADGSVIWHKTAGGDTGRGIAGNFSKDNPGAEFCAVNDGVMYDVNGEKIDNWFAKWNQNFAIYWDGDLEQEALDRMIVEGYGKGRLFTGYHEGATPINASKATANLVADILGDWREEMVSWAVDENGNPVLRVFSTLFPTEYRIATLMHDTQYRCQVASQNVGYTQPAHTSFFLGTGYPLPKQPDIVLTQKKQPSDPEPEPQPDPEPVRLPYEDVEEAAWYYDAIAYNYKAKTMTGLDETHFGPANTLVRGQFAAVLHKMNEKPVMDYKTSFSDVTEGDWYKDAVLWAADKKIVTGYTGTKLFGANDPVTRAQMAAMMYRYAKNYKKYDVKADGDYSRFPDAGDVQGFAIDALKWAVSEGIITGKTIDGQLLLDPQGSANRAECATIIQRFMELYEK